MLVGRAFWEKIGDSATYDELLAISEAVGLQFASTNIAGREPRES